MSAVTTIRAIVVQMIQKRGVIVAAGIFLLLIQLSVFVFYSSFFRSMDNRIYDSFLVSSKNLTSSHVPVIVDLDEQSLAEYGQWPWPRYRVAILLEKMRRLGAVVVATDIVFSEPDRSSPIHIQEELLQELGVKVEFAGLPEALMDNDQVLSNILINGPFVLAYNVLFDGTASGGSNGMHPVQVALSKTPYAEEDASYLINATGAICNLKVLTDAVTGSGFFNTMSDKDGIIRRSPLIIRIEDKYYPSLALASIMRSMGTRQLILKLKYGGIDLRVGNSIIPLDIQGNLMVKYKGKGRTFRYISSADILQDKLPQQSLAGKIVFLGTTAAGLKDLRSTPFDRVCPGVEIHANIIDNVLSREFLYRPDWAEHLELAAALLVGILSTLILIWAPPFWGVAMLGAGVLGLWNAAAWVFHSRGLFFTPLMPIIVLCFNFAGISLVKFWREESEKKYFHNAFSRYVSKSVVDQLVKSRDKLSLSGVEKEVSILFSDIRGFTSISETMASQQLSSLLREYFTPMTTAIIENQGTMDKFIGDAVMAFWNAPLDIENHQVKSVHSALSMLKELDKVNLSFQERFGLMLDIGIGLHSGKVSVGNMGSEDLFDYTVIGDNVNLASRIESLTKTYGLKLLVTESIRTACLKTITEPALIFFEIDRVKVKGKDKSVTIYSTLTPEDAHQRKDEIQVYEHALKLYQERQFIDAEEIFKQLLEDHKDSVLYQMYQRRCLDLIQNPPGPDWDIVFIHTDK